LGPGNCDFLLCRQVPGRATVVVMEYLSTLDAGFLEVEDSDPRTGIAILSYADDLVFGIIADYDAAPDVEELAAGIAGPVARLAALSVVPRRSTVLGTLALVRDRLASDG
jgi:WS/DGAT C-terminal domain